MRKIVIIIVLSLSVKLIIGQVSISYDGSVPDNSSMLEIKAEDKGILIPRISLTSTTSTSPISNPAVSLLIFNTSTINDVFPGYYYWNGTKWVRLSGNNCSMTNYLIKTNLLNNTACSQVYDNGTNVGIGTTNPLTKLHIAENINNATLTLSGGNYKFTTFVGDSFPMYKNPDGIVYFNISGGGASPSYIYNGHLIPDYNYGQYPRNLGKPNNLWNYLYVYDVYLGATNVWLSNYFISDERLKKNITPMNSVLDKIRKLKAVEFDFNTEDYPDRIMSDKHQIGLIAQDVEKVFPELVNTNKEGYKSIDYARLSVILLKAMNEILEKMDEKDK